MALLAHQVKVLDLKVPESSKDQQKQKFGSIAHIYGYLSSGYGNSTHLKFPTP